MQDSQLDKVVYLARSESGRGRAMPYRVEQLRRHAERVLVSALRGALERGEDALDQVARGGGATAEACREGMRMVRLHRHDMEEVLRAGLEYRFSTLVDPEAARYADPAAWSEHGDPVARHLLEELSRPSEATAVAVTEALDSAVPGRRIKEVQNPLAVEQVVDLFVRAQSRMALNLSAGRLLGDVFARVLAEALPRLHREALALLRDGELPDEIPAAGADTLEEECMFDAEAWHSQRAIRGREMVERGRARVAKEISRCLDGRDPPVVVRRLLEEAWARVLFLAYLHDGPDSEAWVRHCAVMERLLWSVEPRGDDADRRRLVLEIPLLLHELGEGLSTVLYDPFDMSKLLRALEAEHLRCLTEADPGLVEAGGAEPDLEANERQAHMRRLQEIPAGTWFELDSRDGERTRVRLAQRTDDGLFIFANRAGFKVMERTGAELAEALVEDRAMILDDHRLFNTALSRVVRRLRDRRAGHGDE